MQIKRKIFCRQEYCYASAVFYIGRLKTPKGETSAWEYEGDLSR
jgi:hypothetical protein